MIRFILFCLIHCFNFSIFAQNSNDTAIHELELYVKEISSVAIDFKQTDSDGHIAMGKLLIDKPLKFRCNYYAPFPLLIIGNKNYLSVYDFEMEQLSRVEAAENIFRFLLMDDIEIEKYFDIKSIITQNNIIKFVLYHKDSNRLSAISFDKSNKQITQMEIIEGDSTTNIAFNSVRKVSRFEPDLFILKNPDVYGPPARLTKPEIEKKYDLLAN